MASLTFLEVSIPNGFLNPMSPNKCAGKIKDMQQTSQVDISGGPRQKNKHTIADKCQRKVNVNARKYEHRNSIFVTGGLGPLTSQLEKRGRTMTNHCKVLLGALDFTNVFLRKPWATRKVEAVIQKLVRKIRPRKK